jgi:hypothetical protein
LSLLCSNDPYWFPELFAECGKRLVIFVLRKYVYLSFGLRDQAFSCAPQDIHFQGTEEHAFEKNEGWLQNGRRLENVLKQIKEDPNLDISGVSDEVCLVLKSLFHIRQDVLLHTLDNIVISKMSMEVVIIELGDGSTYDRSLFLELTKLRSAMINYEAMIAVTVGFVVLLISGEEHVRELVCNHFLAKYFAPV